MVRDGRAELKEIESRLSLVINRGESAGGSGSASAKIAVDNINFPGTGKQIIIYTPHTAGATGLIKGTSPQQSRKVS